MLKVENVNVSYGSVKILWDVDFHIDEGEIITIIGPNGAGKTTIGGSVRTGWSGCGCGGGDCHTGQGHKLLWVDGGGGCCVYGEREEVVANR